MKRLTFLLALTSFLPVQAQTSWTPASMIKFNRVGGTAISTDGKLIAYTISTPMMEGEKSEFLTHIWVASADGRMNYQFTQGDKSCTAPKFSPDGTSLAFISSRGAADAKAQVWMMKLAGGEAESITKSRSGVEDFAWSPDGKRIAFRQRDIDDQEEKMKKEKRDWTIVDRWKFSHLNIIPVEKDAKGMRTTKRLTKSDFHVTDFDWSPDGKTLVFSHTTTPAVEAWPSANISTVPTDSGAVKSLVNAKASETSPLFSPDGQTIAFISDGGDSRWAGISDVYTIPASGGTAKKVGESPDRSANIFMWSTDGKEIFLTETDRTGNRVFAMSLAGGKTRVLTTGAGHFTNASISGDRKSMAYVYQTTETSPQVFTSSMTTFAPKKLSDANKDFGKSAMGKTEIIKWKSKDGREIEGLLTYPVNYKSGGKYPLILNIHGGPAGVFLQTFTGASSVYPIQAFAQQGYAVLRTNPRGSSGYGKEFRHANIKDWGFGDYDDIQTGVDKTIEMGVAHPDSLVICGWSYGGYMTSFTVTKTNRFKAASLGAPVTNLMSFVGTADITGFIPDYFEGEFWQNPEVYAKHSAMFNIKNVKTPSQIIHGQIDPRVPVSQGFEFYTAMKRLGVPTEMITYPRTVHSPAEPKFIQDIGERMIVWFNKNLGRSKGNVGTN